MQSISTQPESKQEESFTCEECLGSKQYPNSWGKTHVPGLAINLTQENPDIMLIGEAPGADEDLYGKPFVGRAGQLLQKTLVELGITKNIYVSNIIKHRPPNNRKPTMLEMIELGNEICKEIINLKPKTIVCLGRSPSDYMMWLAELPVSKSVINGKKGSLRGHQFDLNHIDGWTIPVLCTWHPAYILRVPNKLHELKEDLQKATQGE